MKLPNDLIKATDYSKAKEREIHEFENINGKIIQHYVLGGEHELTMQEIVDCLNALSTIDCDLQTAYAFMHSQQEKNADLEAKLSESEEKINMLEEHKFYVDNIIHAYADKCKQHNQDKISFAVDQLEKVKELFGTKCGYSAETDLCWDIEQYIDNQIKQLKEEK